MTMVSASAHTPIAVGISQSDAPRIARSPAAPRSTAAMVSGNEYTTRDHVPSDMGELGLITRSM